MKHQTAIRIIIKMKPDHNNKNMKRIRFKIVNRTIEIIN